MFYFNTIDLNNISYIVQNIPMAVIGIFFLFRPTDLIRNYHNDIQGYGGNDEADFLQRNNADHHNVYYPAETMQSEMSSKLNSQTLSDKKTRKFIEAVLCKCGRKFSYENLYAYHQKWECGRDLRCKFCQQSYCTLHYVKRHMKACKIRIKQQQQQQQQASQNILPS